MKCPRCKTTDLKPTMIEEFLPAAGCSDCGGSLVSLVYYRHWAETHQPPAELGSEDTTISVETTDTTSALNCPKCARVMMKYKLTGTVSNRLDACSLCEEAWLDRGEWELLAALQLSHLMPSIFTDAWQRRIRREQVEGGRRLNLARRIGEQGVEKVEQFAAWLNQNQHKADILVYLYRE
jgi:Zn-finger nucleic acid-binding protein